MLDQGAPPLPQPRFDEVLQWIIGGFVRADQSLFARVNVDDKHAGTPGGAFIGESFQNARLDRADSLHIDLDPAAAGQPGPPSCFIRDAKFEQARRVRLHYLQCRADYFGLDAAAGHRTRKIPVRVDGEAAAGRAGRRPPSLDDARHGNRAARLLPRQGLAQDGSV